MLVVSLDVNLSIHKWIWRLSKINYKIGEFIWVCTDQAGIQIGVQFWSRMMMEHYIGSDGRPTEDGPRGNVDSMFDMNENE